MAETDRQFSGSIPESYERYLGPFLFEPYARDLVARVPAREGLRVLEIAAGTGRVTRLLRQRLPASATIVATDLNEAMIAVGSRTAGASGITWRAADAQELPFDDASFDAVVCQFGMMFLPDKAKGFREARRVLTGGGVFLASVWGSIDENPPAKAIQTALERAFPGNPPRFLDVPHGFHDPEAIERMLREAGFVSAAVEAVALVGESPSARDVALGFTTGSPLTHQLLERGADPVAVAGALEEELAAAGGRAPFRARLLARIATARR